MDYLEFSGLIFVQVDPVENRIDYIGETWLTLH